MVFSIFIRLGRTGILHSLPFNLEGNFPPFFIRKTFRSYLLHDSKTSQSRSKLKELICLLDMLLERYMMA
ncbi:hypothetical protein AG1IA_06431 [Rhizoctonia solani AG-1 IA]|uniref:Uncharacterized protein n=1 Tax=Thanatephorus cucumeris (strain AG1-IA) TaxID=983506 RepID=L8WNH4_THACA|nr:hypothetical protein AG1IA_06431 [Rhizoctonia solani AG-1 IA]